MLLASSVSSAKNYVKDEGFTVWSWSPNVIYKVDEMIEFAKENNITKVFQYFNFNNTQRADINNFVKKLKENNISVYALSGESSWAHAKNHAKFELWADHIIAYNNEYPDERIIGMSLDIEIYLEKNFNIPEQKQQLLYDYQNLTWFIKNKAKENNLVVNHTIPFWYDNEKGHIDHGLYDLSEWAFLMGDEVSIMAYNHKSLEKIIEKEMDYANTYGKSVYLGFETQMVGVHGLEEANTYYRRGIDRMYYDFERIKNKYPSINIVNTIHNYNSFKALLSLQSDLLWINENPVAIAEKSKKPLDLDFARKIVNALPYSSERDSLQIRLNNISPNMSAEIKNSTSNLDVYIKSENMLSLSLDTNLIMFDNFSGIDDLEKPGAVNLTVNSSLPYELNVYLPVEIQNNDKSKTMDKQILNIKEGSDVDYKAFSNINQKLILKDNNVAGNNKSHVIDLKLKGGLAYEADTYRAIVQFEIKQK